MANVYPGPIGPPQNTAFAGGQTTRQSRRVSRGGAGGAGWCRDPARAAALQRFLRRPPEGAPQGGPNGRIPHYAVIALLLRTFAWKTHNAVQSRRGAARGEDAILDFFGLNKRRAGESLQPFVGDAGTWGHVAAPGGESGINAFNV